MHLYVIRHAQSANNDLYARLGGSQGRVADPPLTDLGHRQAQHLARRLAPVPGDARPPDSWIGEYAARHNRLGFGLTHLYCSLMTRAIQTAGYIADATGLPLIAWPEIHERGGLHQLDEATGEDAGVPGPNRAHFQTTYPHLLLPDTLGEAGWWNRPPEPVADALHRARTVWSGLLELHGQTGDRVAFVTHAGFFQSLVAILIAPDGSTLGNPTWAIDELWFGISNASISRIEIDGGIVAIRYLNQVDHLPSEMITG